jgi:hypothetical protein
MVARLVQVRIGLERQLKLMSCLLVSLHVIKPEPFT